MTFTYTFCFPSLHTGLVLTRSVQTVNPLFVWHPLLPHYFTSLRTHRPLHNLLPIDPQSAAACYALVLRYTFFMWTASHHTIYDFYNSVFCLGVKLGIVFFFPHIRTVHLDIIKVLFIHQLMHQWVVSKNDIKIYIKTAPTWFGVTVTPSLVSALIRAY